MKSIIPVITEKSMLLAKNGKYTFQVERNMTKYDVKRIVNELFDVHVVNVKTLNSKIEIKKTNSGRTKVVKPVKKAIVTLKDKEKIDLFIEEKKGGKK
jgi:ribosomal protein L23